MNLITNVFDICITQGHIVIMLFSVGAFVGGLTIVYIEAKKTGLI